MTFPLSTSRTSRFLWLCLALCLCLAWTSLAHARRAALIIGNSGYVNASQLSNTTNDARMVAASAQKAGFNVTLALDLNRDQFNQALRDFRQQAAGAEVAMVYYAGHGIEGAGKNWLLPVDVKLSDPRDLSLEALELDTILATLDDAQLRIVALDACRENPFGNAWRSGTRSVSKGLAETEIDGALVLYAAAGGQLAVDTTGAGTGSPFAAALARRLPEPGLSIHRLGPSIRDDVISATGGVQTPWMSVSIASAEITLVPAPKPVVPMTPAPAPVAPAPVQNDAQLSRNDSMMWAGADLSGTAESYQSYIDANPQGQFVNLARIKLERLRAAPAPAPAPAPAVASPAFVTDRFPGTPVAGPAPIMPPPAPPSVAVVGPPAPVPVISAPMSATPAPAPIAAAPAPQLVIAAPAAPVAPSPVVMPAAQAPVAAPYIAPAPAPIPAIAPTPVPAPLQFMTALHNPRDSKPLPALPQAPRLSRDGYPTCRESYQGLAGPIEKANAIKSCIEELNRFSTVVFNGFAQAMIQHQQDISKLYSEQVGAQPAYTPESQNWFYTTMMQEHANSNPNGPHYAEFAAVKRTYDEDRAYLQDRFCFYTGTCGGYAPPPGVAPVAGQQVTLPNR